MSLPNATKPLLLGSTAAYRVSRSLRFNSADSALLTRAPISTSNRRTFTWSGWVKRSTLSSASYKTFFASEASGSNYSFLGFYLDNITWQNYDGTNNFVVTTTALFRDPASWCHIVCAVNTTSATSTDRVKIYSNGILQTVTSGYPSLNYDVRINTSAFTAKHGFSSGTGAYFDGYLANIDFIDGQALTPSSFAETNATTGQWVPKAYAGTYGTNGFKLNFSNNSAATAATLGADSSGNGNNFTPTNLSVTAGVGNDSLTDTPTQYGSDTGLGGEVRGNYCTLNSIIPSASGITNGNLDATGAAQGTFDITSGSWYWESTASATAAGGIINSAGTAYTTAIASGVTRGFRYASSTTTLESTINGSSWTTISAAVAGQPFPYVLTGATSSNFGQRAFTYTAPSGYKALCVQNLSTPTIVLPSAAFDAKLYTGTGSSQSITGLGFSPDLVWIKSRSAATDNTLYDSVRGAQARLESNNLDVEVTSDAGLTAFNATGFTVNTLAQVNTSAATYVGWCWDESVSAGFDIVTYTGNGGTQNISHSLGVAPKLMILKCRATVQRWTVYNGSLGAGYYGYLNETFEFETGNNQLRWGNNSTSVAPTSSVFTIGNSVDVNQSGSTYVAYLWAEVDGFSKFGSYTGNGIAGGPFVHCGFKPRFVLIKHSSGAGNNWRIWDSSRFTSNENKTSIYPSLANAESVEANGIDILSNGFKVRWSDGAINGSAATYVFMAFAENPFKYANAK